MADTDAGNEGPCSGSAVLGLIGVVFVLVLMYRNSDLRGFIPLLDHANLAFHEAGHLFFGVFGSTLGLYGGTLGQLVFPVVVTVSFLRKGAFAAAALGSIWLFQNLLNIARYVADARAQELPLVGGGEHDWFNILTRWGALASDTTLARVIAGIAWTGMVATLFWIVIIWNRDRE